MKICLIVSGFPPEILAGTEKQAENLTNAFIEKGIKILVVTGTKSHRYPFSYKSKMREICYIPIISRIILIQAVFFILISLLFLISKRKQYDIIHVHSVNIRVIIPALIVSKLFSIPMVIKFTGSLEFHLSVLNNRFSANLYHLSTKADAIITNNFEVKTGLAKFGFKNIYYIQNGINIDKFKVSQKELDNRIERIASKKFTLGYLGRIHQTKSISTLLEALDILHQLGYKEIKLSIYGEEINSFGETNRLKAKIRELGINQFVFFCGQILDVSEGLKNIDVFILPSIGEGQSNSLIEAMAGCVPTVVSDVSGNREMINRKNGYLFEVLNAVDLAHKIQNLINNNYEIRKKVINAFDIIKKTHSLEKSANKYLSVTVDAFLSQNINIVRDYNEK